MNLKAKGNNVIWHIVGCLCFLSLPVFISPHPPNQQNFLLTGPAIRDFIANLFMIGFFYLNFYYLIPKFYLTKKYLPYAFCVVVSLAVILLLPSFLSGYVPWREDIRPPAFFRPRRFEREPTITNYLTMVSHVLLLFVSVVLFSILLKVQEQLLKAEKEKYVSELNSLKNQINPHFLFNTLNSIYAFAIREKSTLAASSLMKLSGLMRYVVTETTSQFVLLEKEISYVKDYVSLQQMRLDNKVELHFQVEETPTGLKIAPLLLIPFIENAFKHGVNPDENSSIQIQIKTIDNELLLFVKNNKVNVNLEDHEKSGKGISNAKSRLELMYPEAHSLSISETEMNFTVTLKINLK